MDRKIQLFCIPYAGGTCEIFDGFCGCFHENIESVKIEYAGHGIRMKESFYLNFQEMVEDVARHINAQLNDNMEPVLFGYSMGSIVVYELLAQNLLEKVPVFILLASHEAPDVEWESKEYYMLDDLAFFYKIQQMGGFQKCTPEKLENRFFKKMLFDTVRNDYDLIGNYKMSKKIKLDVPAILFYSDEDIPISKIELWDSFLGEKSEIIAMDGGHFFIRKHAVEMAQILEHELDVLCGV